ncbi:MAG: carbon-nitrogen family hydrolase [Candidatus Pristimantibacillus lignocellulolyticus]|uniref:Carbon-nitrogen family hydrolase n=1 Tax=Candidatus Pristimantibacillus lignocellulolyticus TaxID=2994561 RepID=A0A9J6ZDX7_9BACL|nr:MAG: carbon-nitrogen family hydrolase [Candidatus Pristimantibacillus lignocellulolyticus]
MSQTLKFAIIQMHVEVGNVEANTVKLKNKLYQAVSADQKPDVILFPEMWNTGYALTEITTLADRNGESTKLWLSQFAAEHKVNIVAGSIAESKEDGVYNTIYAFNRNGEVISDYSKLHLFRLMDEEKYLQAGDKVGQLQIDGIDAGMMICYDIRFPELFRRLALDGAKVMFVPAQWPNPRLHHWRTLLMARAIENQMYVIACNRMGISGESEFFGHSIVIDPWGEIVAEAGDEETILSGEIDMSIVDKVRSTIPVFKDRRPEQY